MTLVSSVQGRFRIATLRLDIGALQVLTDTSLELAAAAKDVREALELPIATVVDKRQPSPTGDAHDYVRQSAIGTVGERRMHVEDLLDHALRAIDRRGDDAPRPGDHEQCEQNAERAPHARDVIECTRSEVGHARRS